MGRPASAVTSAGGAERYGCRTRAREASRSVARITEISSTSTKSFEDALQQGVARATKTLRHVRSAWVKEQQVRVDGNKIAEYQVNLLVSFVLEDGDQG